MNENVQSAVDALETALRAVEAIRREVYTGDNVLNLLHTARRELERGVQHERDKFGALTDVKLNGE